MLVLTRRMHEELVITLGDQKVVVRVVGVARDRVRLGITRRGKWRFTVLKLHNGSQKRKPSLLSPAKKRSLFDSLYTTNEKTPFENASTLTGGRRSFCASW